jgi:hypothetical protein
LRPSRIALTIGPLNSIGSSLIPSSPFAAFMPQGGAYYKPKTILHYFRRTEKRVSLNAVLINLQCGKV